MAVSRAIRALVLVAALVLLSPLALWAGAIGVIDFRYQLAGLADPFLGRPAPGVSIIVGAILSLAFAGLAVGLQRLWRSSGGEGPGLGRWWLLVPVVAWTGYFGGAASVVAAGGPTAYAGTLTLDFGQPVASSVEATVSCRSVVGQPLSIAELRTSGVDISLRNLATGDEKWLPAVNWDYRPDSTVSLVPPPARGRLPILQQMLDGRGGILIEEQRGFYGAYMAVVQGHTDSGLKGSLALHLSREEFPDDKWVRYLNVTVPDDPWPAEVDVTASWKCGA